MERNLYWQERELLLAAWYLGMIPTTVTILLRDLNEPHIVRALHHLKTEAIYTGHSAYHAVCVDSRGNAHFIGRNTHSCFGVSADTKPSTKALEEHTVQAKSLRAASRQNRIVNAACSRGHTVLVGSDGKAWSAGLNTSGQCGQVSDDDDERCFERLRRS